jgi:hypothetical protein
VLPRQIFSDQFVDFVNKCLKKNAAERSNLAGLALDPFYKQHAAMDDGAEFAKWVQSVIDMFVYFFLILKFNSEDNFYLSEHKKNSFFILDSEFLTKKSTS